VVIEGFENHTRTGFLEISLETLASQGIASDKPLRIPVTHAKIFGWYDNEYGSYTTSLADLTCYVDRLLT
jgi:glyceraldehyde 3-phosphate dehydrogenase